MTDPITIGKSPPKNPPRQKNTKYKPIKLDKAKSKPKQKPRKTFDQRIAELTEYVKQTQVDSIEETIIYLGRQIKKLYLDIKKLEPKVKKKQQNDFNKIHKRSKELIYSFDEKFENFKLLETGRPKK